MFEQAALPVAYDALEPTIDSLTMETHYAKHHATYTKTLNELAEKAGKTDVPIEELLSNLDSIPDETLRKGIRNHGGGYYNHNLYFSTLGTDNHTPTGVLAEKINQTFGSIEAFQEKISNLAVTQFGSGWAFLSVTPDGGLVLSQSPNQDNPYSEKTGNVPIFAIDVWEHAYYLKYKNLRAQYVSELFKVIDWKVVEENYKKAIA